MIQHRWPGRWEGNLAERLEELTCRIDVLTGDGSVGVRPPSPIGTPQQEVAAA